MCIRDRAAAATGSRLTVSNVIPKHLESITAKLEEMGVGIEEHDESVTVIPHGRLGRVNVKTLPYPGFPTDMNPDVYKRQLDKRVDELQFFPAGMSRDVHVGNIVVQHVDAALIQLVDDIGDRLLIAGNRR